MEAAQKANQSNSALTNLVSDYLEYIEQYRTADLGKYTASLRLLRETIQNALSN